MELDGWLHAAAECAGEVATAALGIESTAWRQVPVASLPHGLWGAYIPLLCTPGQSMQLGLLAGHDTCKRLTCALLGVPPEESSLTDADIFDAVSEVTNLVAGGLKARVDGEVHVTLGVPLSFSGRVFPGAEGQSTLGLLQLDRDDVWLMLTGARSK